MSNRDTFDRAALRAQLQLEERMLLKPYRDTVGKWTIGIGRNLDDVGIRPAETHALGITRESCFAKGVTPSQAYYLCDADIDVAADALDANLPWWRGLDAVRQRVLLDMCFNMGIGRAPGVLLKAKGLLSFTNTLALIQGHYYAAAADALASSKWDAQTGTRADRLERQLRTGVA